MQATLVRGNERSEGPAAPMGLVEGASAGLIRRHWASVRRYLRVLGADDASADDLAQETFVLALHKGIEDRGAPTGAWLRRAARNLLRNDARKRRNVNLEDADQVWDERGDQGDARQQALRDCMPLLTERGQTALRLAYGERKSWAEIGAALGMKASGVKTLLRRCRDTLRACIDKNTDSTPGATR